MRKSFLNRLSAVVVSFPNCQSRFRQIWKPIVLVMSLLAGSTSSVLAAAKFVSGFVPDWNQPYHYSGVSTNGGPGADPNRPNPPNPFAPTDQWNDWCAPSSAANLAGHWTDARGVPVADTAAFPVSTFPWAHPSWQDYLADGFARPAPTNAPALPPSPTDIGWYMDTNLGVPYDVGVGVMGGYFFGNAPHRGTYLKDTHVGLQNFLNFRYGLSGSIFWQTGTRGIGFAAGVNPAGAPATVHLNAGSAFNEIKSEIDTNRTLILSFRHWSIAPAGFNLPSRGGATNESWYGGAYFTWGATPGPNPTNAEDEAWNYGDNGTALGHAVTCVGYIPANDPDDLYHGTPNATDWVIVHDNWSTTARSVIVPLNYANTWVANTTAVPWPTAAKFVKGLVPDWNQPYRYSPQNNPPSPSGGPGPDPAVGVVNQWNAWCAPSSAANLAGHWMDYHGAPVADTTAFPGSTVVWVPPPPAASWQDYLADGFARPAPTNAPGLPPSPTDIGWYMDTNLGVPYDAGGGMMMGGYFFGNQPHTGTYVKDIHIGLQNYLDSLYSTAGGCWNTGTEGKAFAGGLNPTGGVAQVHAAEPTAFNEVKFEIDRNHTLIVSFKHWNVGAAGGALPFDGTNTESALGGSYYYFESSPGSSNAEDEEWNLEENGLGLGHAVTVVGYIPAFDVLDLGPSLGMGPTDWVIVHDNWAATPRNVVVPFDWNNWVATTTAYPDPGFLQITRIAMAAGTNAVVSFNGMPSALHHLEWKSDLTNSTWTCCVSNMSFCSGTMQATNSVASGTEKRFYRIKANY